uniref:Uncharacterized protein MANES_12G067200 n=1 Tax=Rhizophora mucronata TaxID=61149 RepID=A0A2P2JFU4_RHIMU
MYDCGYLGHKISFYFQVSVLLVEMCVPPTLLCAVNEVLTQIIGEALSDLPTIIVPFLATPSKLKWDRNTLMVDGTKFSGLYSLDIGPETDITRAIASRTQKLPSTLQIHYEPLACILQLVRTLNLPTSVLTGKSGLRLSDRASGEELEILCKIGELLANTAYLSFERERIKWNPSKTSKESQEPWRALYG